MKKELINQSRLSLYISHFITPFFLALSTALTYWPSLHYEFQFDDLANITRYYNIRHSTFEQLFFSGTRWISFWLNTLQYKIGMFDPFFYRLFNVGLHIANGLLIYFLLLYGLSRLRDSSFFKENAYLLASITTLLFLLHPVQTQTVSYVIQGQLEGLATFFILSMSSCLMFFAQISNRWPKRALVILLCALAFLSTGSKEIAVISPALLLLIDWFLIAQGSWHRFKKHLWIHALISGIVICCYLWLLKPTFFIEILGLQKIAHNSFGNMITADPKTAITPWLFFISQFKVVLHYLAIFIWPMGLSVEYDWLLARSFYSADCLLPFLAIGMILLAIISLLKKNRASLIAFGLLWFFVSIAPRSSIIPCPELLVDYKTYTASFGWLFLIACSLVFGAPILAHYLKTSPKIAHILPSMLTILLIFGTYSRNTVWRSGLEFWGNILENAPKKARAHNNYGFELAKDKKRMQQAISYFEKAIELDPGYGDAYNNLAVIYGALGNQKGAMLALEKSLSINANHPESLNNLASLYLQNGEYEKAKNHLHLALKLRPHYGKAYFNLGCVHVKTGQHEKAWECFKNCCLKGDLDTELGFSTYAHISFQLKKWDHAIVGFEKVLEQNPKNSNALFQLGNSHYFAGDFQKAKIAYTKLLELNPTDDKVWFNLGEANRELEDYTAAIAAYLRIAHPKAINEWPQSMAECKKQLREPQKVS